MVDDLLGGRGAPIKSTHFDRNGVEFEIITYPAQGETWVVRTSF